MARKSIHAFVEASKIARETKSIWYITRVCGLTIPTENDLVDKKVCNQTCQTCTFLYDTLKCEKKNGAPADSIFM